MTEKNPTSPLIANAIIWAALMLATSLILADVPGDRKTMLIILQIAGWFSVNQLLTKGGTSIRAEWACIRRRIGR